MGWWKMLTNVNNAEGIREAMRMSYGKHLNLARSGEGPADGTPDHHVGLYGALATRYRLRGASVPELSMWGSLAPFLAMSERDGVEALAEYAVLQERPGEAKRSWLSSAVNRALRNARDQHILTLAHVGLVNQVDWCDLLEPDTQQSLWERASEALDDMAEDDDV